MLVVTSLDHSSPKGPHHTLPARKPHWLSTLSGQRSSWWGHHQLYCTVCLSAPSIQSWHFCCLWKENSEIQTPKWMEGQSHLRPGDCLQSMPIEEKDLCGEVWWLFWLFSARSSHVISLLFWSPLRPSQNAWSIVHSSHLHSNRQIAHEVISGINYFYCFVFVNALMNWPTEASWKSLSLLLSDSGVYLWSIHQTSVSRQIINRATVRQCLPISPSGTTNNLK